MRLRVAIKVLRRRSYIRESARVRARDRFARWVARGARYRSLSAEIDRQTKACEAFAEAMCKFYERVAERAYEVSGFPWPKQPFFEMKPINLVDKT